MKKSQTMKKLVMLYVALLALAATTACRSGKRIALSDNPICTTSFVKAEIQYRTDSASNVEWGESEPFDCQPLVDYLCRCRARKEPMKFLPYVVVRLYDNNHNEYWLGFSASGRALKIEGRTFRMSKRDSIEIEKLLAAANVAERYGTLKGRVVESGTKRPYMAANVLLKQNGQLVGGATTDEDGCYTIRHIPFGDYTIEVHAIGCKPLEEDVTIGYPTFAIRHFVVDPDSSRITCALPVVPVIGTLPDKVQGNYYSQGDYIIECKNTDGWRDGHYLLTIDSSSSFVLKEVSVGVGTWYTICSGYLQSQGGNRYALNKVKEEYPYGVLGKPYYNDADYCITVKTNDTIILQRGQWETVLKLIPRDSVPKEFDFSRFTTNLNEDGSDESYPYQITMIAAPLDIMTVVDIPPEAFDRGWHYCDTVVISNPDTIRRIVHGMMDGAMPNKNGGIDTRGKLILKYHDRDDVTVYYNWLYMMIGGRYYYADKNVTGWLNELREQARKQK